MTATYYNPAGFAFTEVAEIGGGATILFDVPEVVRVDS
jgi:hypothetical protein